MLRNLLAQDNGDYQVNFTLGRLYDRAGRSDLSIPLFRRALQIRPGSFDAAMYLGVAERDQNMPAEALAHLEKAASIMPDNANIHALLARLHIERDDIAAASKALHRAIELQPDSAELYTQLGTLYAIVGKPADATMCYRRAISHDRQAGAAHYGLARLGQIHHDSEDLQRMQQALRSCDISDRDRILTGHAMGMTLDSLARYDEAFEYFDEANRLKRESISYSFDEQKRMFERHTQALNQEFVDYCVDCRVPDDSPVFVLGMPRSGTSLVEQILASHPMVYGAGEVEYARQFAEEVRKMTGKPFPIDIATIAPAKLSELAKAYVGRLTRNTGTAVRVIDKLPHNFLRIGLFAALMPRAKIIQCERDPIDTCMSIFKHDFSAGHGYATNLRELGRYYKLYDDLMSHWRNSFPDRIFRLNYENLIGNADAQIRKLLDYCNLPFDTDCLSFHATSRSVNTPSAQQVRQPLHSDAVGNASHYRQHLQPLFDALA